MKEKTEVIIAGKKYIIVGDEKPEYVEKVANYVDDKMSALLSNNSELTHEGAAVLAAINITEEFFKADEAADNLRAQVGNLISEQRGRK